MTVVAATKSARQRARGTSRLPSRERQQTATRLLASAAKLSYDPLTEIDWEAPWVEGMPFADEKRLSLYGTELWETMTAEQRIELGKHEVASIASVGIWFELILMQMLVRHAYHRDATTAHVQFALTEIADECRHSTMFAKMIAKMGDTQFRVDPRIHHLSRLFKATSSPTQTFAGAMFVEEILDAFQREAMDDESLQPLVRKVSRIHVVEESRHITYAREEVLRRRLSAGARRYEQFMVGVIVYCATTQLVRPQAYAAAGLDPAQASAAAAVNPHWRATKTAMAAKVIEVLDSAGLVGRPNRLLLRKAGVLG